jgi:hypothetical protein
MNLRDKLQNLATRMFSGSADIDIGIDSFRILLQEGDWLDSKAMYTLLEEERIKLVSIQAKSNRISIIGRFDI